MTLRDSTATLQRLLGIPDDGDYGPITAAHAIEAVRERNALRERLSPPGLAGTAAAAGGVTVSPDGVKPLSGTLQPSDKAFATIREFEGYAKALPDGRCEAYPDPGSGGDPWTIGFGSTGPGISRGVIWTREQAEQRLEADVRRFAAGVAAQLDGAATTQNEFDALVSFAYNVGLGNLKSSTLLRKHKAGDKAGAANEFAKWNKAAGRVMQGLTRRRTAEADLYQGLMR